MWAVEWTRMGGQLYARPICTRPDGHVPPWATRFPCNALARHARNCRVFPGAKQTLNQRDSSRWAAAPPVAPVGGREVQTNAPAEHNVHLRSHEGCRPADA